MQLNIYKNGIAQLGVCLYILYVCVSDRAYIEGSTYFISTGH